jgi:hypothetical protein
MFFALLGAILLAGCGSNDTTSQSTFNNGSGDQPFKPVTHLLHRSLVTNSFAGQLQVFDTLTGEDKLTAFTFPTGLKPTYMQPSPDSTLTFVNNSGSNSISSLNNNLEAVKATINLNGSTDSFVTSNSNEFGFAAVADYLNGTFRLPGAIVRFNPTDGSLNTQIMFPHVQTIGMDLVEKHLLAFTNNDNNAYWVDFTASDDPKTQVPPVYALTLSGSVQLSRPVAAFFSSDSTKAFILSCGVECGGTQASVTEIDISTLTLTTPQIGVPNTGTVTVVKQWLVNGAQSGYIDRSANKLYVVGGGSSTQGGFFTTINLADTTAIPTSLLIGNGGNRIIRNINGIFWVGARNCGVQSCITRVNPSANTAAILPIAHGDATGISLSQNSGETYTIEGFELFIYDKNANPFISENPTDVKGEAYDVLYIN